MRWLTDLITRKNRKPEIKERSASRLDDLTTDERTYMVWAFENEHPPCPDCQKGSLLRGPEGGGSQNCMCNHCTSEFNLCFFGGVIGERISDAGNGDPDRVRNLYGINLTT